MVLSVILMIPLIVWAIIDSYNGVLTRTVPIISAKANGQYQTLKGYVEPYRVPVSSVNKATHVESILGYQEIWRSVDSSHFAQSVLNLDEQTEKQIIGAGVDLYSMISGDRRFLDESSILLQRHGDMLLMLSPTHQAWKYCNTYPERCKKLLNDIMNGETTEAH